MALGGRHPRVEPRLLRGLPQGVGARWRPGRRPTRRQTATGRPRAPGPSRPGSRSRTACSSVDGPHRALSGARHRAFLIFLGSPARRPPTRARFDLKAPLLVGFFLAGLVIHGGLQGWWISRSSAACPKNPCSSVGAPDGVRRPCPHHVPRHAGAESQRAAKIAVVEGAVAGGGLTVIDNAPNPAGQSLLSKYFGGAIFPIGCFLAPYCDSRHRHHVPRGLIWLWAARRARAARLRL